MVSRDVIDDITKLNHALIDEEGKEINNPKPLFLDVSRQKKSESIREEMRRILRQELSYEAFRQGEETFDDANDFDVKSDFETDREFSEYSLAEEEEPKNFIKEIQDEQIRASRHEPGSDPEVGKDNSGGSIQDPSDDRKPGGSVQENGEAD